jgi:hypothetical protein
MHQLCLNYPENLSWQVSKSICILDFLSFDARCCKLSLDEAKPDGWFLLSARRHFELGGPYRHGKLMTDRLPQWGREVADKRSPGGDEGIVPGGGEEPADHFEIGLNKQHELGLTDYYCIGEQE